MRHLVIGGCGQVGSAICDFLKENKEYISIIDKKMKSKVLWEYYDFIHICIPYDKDFVKTVEDCIFKHKYSALIIYSTVPVGTTKQLNAVHSPIEGRHSQGLLKAFKTFTRFIAGKDSKKVAKFFESKGLKTKTFKVPEITELGKLLSTTRYGLSLVFSQVQQNICDKFRLDYNNVVSKYVEMYNDGYEGTNFIQPNLYPPGKKIGGHCIIPNAKTLNSQYNHKLINIVGGYNDGTR